MRRLQFTGPRTRAHVGPLLLLLADGAFLDGRDQAVDACGSKRRSVQQAHRPEEISNHSGSIGGIAAELYAAGLMPNGSLAAALCSAAGGFSDAPAKPPPSPYDILANSGEDGANGFAESAPQIAQTC
jgi:hypothetical protein